MTIEAALRGYEKRTEHLPGQRQAVLALAGLLSDLQQAKKPPTIACAAFLDGLPQEGRRAHLEAMQELVESLANR